MTKSGKDIFCWIPNHIGMYGNMAADLIAKSTINISNKSTKY